MPAGVEHIHSRTGPPTLQTTAHASLAKSDQCCAPSSRPLELIDPQDNHIPKASPALFDATAFSKNICTQSPTRPIQYKAITSHRHRISTRTSRTLALQFNIHLLTVQDHPPSPEVYLISQAHMPNSNAGPPSQERRSNRRFVSEDQTPTAQSDKEDTQQRTEIYHHPHPFARHGPHHPSNLTKLRTVPPVSTRSPQRRRCSFFVPKQQPIFLPSKHVVFSHGAFIDLAVGRPSRRRTYLTRATNSSISERSHISSPNGTFLSPAFAHILTSNASISPPTTKDAYSQSRSCSGK